MTMEKKACSHIEARVNLMLTTVWFQTRWWKVSLWSASNWFQKWGTEDSSKFIQWLVNHKMGYRKVILTFSRLVLSATGLFKYVWPFSGQQVLKYAAQRMNHFSDNYFGLDNPYSVVWKSVKFSCNLPY